MRIVNEPENEGQYVELLTLPRRAAPSQWQWDLAVGFDRHRLAFGIEAFSLDGTHHGIVLSFGPLYIAVVGNR